MNQAERKGHFCPIIFEDKRSRVIIPEDPVVHSVISLTESQALIPYGQILSTEKWNVWTRILPKWCTLRWFHLLKNGCFLHTYTWQHSNPNPRCHSSIIYYKEIKGPLPFWRKHLQLYPSKIYWIRVFFISHTLKKMFSDLSVF